MNLENLNVTELDAREKSSIDGGDWWDAVVFVAETMIETSLEAAAEVLEFGAYLAAGIADGIESGLGGCDCNGTGS